MFAANDAQIAAAVPRIVTLHDGRVLSDVRRAPGAAAPMLIAAE